MEKNNEIEKVILIYCHWNRWTKVVRDKYDLFFLWTESVNGKTFIAVHQSNMLELNRIRAEAGCICWVHYSDVIMSAMASQITGVSIDYSTVSSGADHKKHQSPASLAFVRRIHRWPVNSPHKGPVTRKMFTFDDVIMPDPFFGIVS